MTTPTGPAVHSADWLADVQEPGPNNTYFSNVPNLLGADAEIHDAAVGLSLMEDNIHPNEFTPGMAAYAGYTDGLFANMPAVQAYAKTQGALSFSYTPLANPAANANDMEPGNVGPSSFPGFYTAKGGKNVYGYGSASWLSQIISAASGAGIVRSAYKLVSAHYIGSHICGPGTCGYPQADATQYADNYVGNDITLCSAGFFPGTAPDSLPLGPGSNGTLVATVQRLLNKWASFIHVSPLLTVDGAFGPLTEAAVKLALLYWHYSATNVAKGQVDSSLYAHLSSPVPATSYPAPVGLKVIAAGPHSVKAEWQAPAIPPGMPTSLRYDLFVRHNNVLVKGYPRTGINALEVQEGSLNPETAYVLSLVATDSNGGHFAGSKAASVAFKTA